VCERTNGVRGVLDTGVGSAHRLEFDLPDAGLPVTVDPTEFETALVNLVINARDAMAGGGTITGRAHAHDGGEETGGQDYVGVTVRDTGDGIPPDVLDKIFDPFFTTKPVGKGTGLGLSQVHGFAHQAGGTVRVKGGLGRGTGGAILAPGGW